MSIDFRNIKALTIPEGAVKKITANGILLWEKEPGYQLLEYLQFDGSSYVDTGFIPANNGNGQMDVSITFELNNPTNGTKRLYGCYDGTNYGQTLLYTIVSNAANNMMSMVAGNTQRGNRYVNLVGSKVNVLTYSHATYMGWKSDFTGATSMMEGGVSGNPAVNLPMYLGKCNGSADEGLVGKVYSFQIASYHYPITMAENKLLRSYVPARRIVDGALGLLDTLSNTFYPGTGNIVAGNAIA